VTDDVLRARFEMAVRQHTLRFRPGSELLTEAHQIGEVVGCDRVQAFEVDDAVLVGDEIPEARRRSQAPRSLPACDTPRAAEPKSRA
jgi:hypothetical protein